ncbi:MAG: hypothetical protein ABIJ45_07175 [Candidatus Zixiibacteriota bacterium]
MQKNKIDKNKTDANWSREIDLLTDQVRTLALNLAVSLARSKNEIKELTILEPEFTKLVNGSVEVVKEVSAILKTFRNEEKMVYDPSSNSGKLDRIESSLNEIHDLSKKVLNAINTIKKQKKQVDNYK